MLIEIGPGLQMPAKKIGRPEEMEMLLGKVSAAVEPAT